MNDVIWSGGGVDLGGLDVFFHSCKANSLWEIHDVRSYS